MLLPLQCGGSPDEPEKSYRVLRSAMGKGGTALDETGIDGLWRRSIALGLTIGASALRRAFINGIPSLAMDMIQHYERVLAITPASGTPDAMRREAIAALWSASASATIPDLVSELRRIDARFTVESVEEEQTSSCMDGRWFAPIYGSSESSNDPWNNFGNCSALAGPTTRYRVTAFLNVDDDGNLTDVDVAAMRASERRLRAMLPSWEGFAVSAASGGFVTDQSPLDWTVLDDG